MTYLTDKEINELEKKAIQDEWRLSYHLMPPTGWLNDPNGLCQFKGEYHICYQYAPEDSKGSRKYWGHYKTKDFITFEKLPVPLFPDNEYDQHGVYSGSAIVKDDKMYLYYTGNVKHEGNHDYIYSGRGHNTMLAISRDGIHYENKECLMTNDDYPHDMSCHVRDPQVIKKDNDYYMILGARSDKDVGCCLLYKSKDLYNFEYVNRIQSDSRFGYMWECPNLIDFDNQMVMICCPQGVETEGYHYENLYQNGYYIIDGNIEDEYSLSDFVELDYGFDFYAPQVMKDDKGRVIMIGWMGLPDVPYTNPTIKSNWQHALTLPRELTYKDNHIYQYPISETKDLRLKELDISLKSNQQIDINNLCYEFNLLIDNKEFEIELREDVKLKYTNKLLTLTMGKSGYGRETRHIEVDEIEDVTIFSDTSSLEVFINHGQYTLTTRVYSNNTSIMSNIDLVGKCYLLRQYNIK